MPCKYQYSKKLHCSTVKEAATCNLLTDVFVFVIINNSVKYCYILSWSHPGLVLATKARGSGGREVEAIFLTLISKFYTAA